MPRRLRIAKGLGFVPWLRLAAWALLASCVALTVLGLPADLTQRIAKGELPRWIYLSPAIAFSCFVLAFAVYRTVLVRRGHYQAGRAYLQVGLSVLVLTWLWIGGMRSLKQGQVPGAVQELALIPFLENPDPQLRSLACEALRSRSTADPARPMGLKLAHSDPDPRVRASCGRL